MGIKKNFTYSSILVISGYIFPILTFPYVSRILGVTNIGICDFVDSIITYFMQLSMMGVAIIGIREIAKYKNDKQALSRTFSSLFMLNAIGTCIVLAILILVTIFVPKFTEHWDLMLLGGVKLLFNLFLIEWFFRGLENFKYITIRSLIIKIFFVCSIFIFIKNSEDYNIYYALMCFSVVVNAIYNWWYKSKYISLDIHNISLKKYFRPFIFVGLYGLITFMYTSFNPIYLGFIGGPTEVGYYTTAIKLYTIILSVFSAFTGVMLPRMSALIAEEKTDEVKRLLYKSIDVLLCFSFPIIAWSMVFAPDIIAVIAGKGYEGAIIPMRILIPLILIIGIEQILVIQILIPMKADKAIVLNSIIGVSVGLTINILFVHKFLSIGSSIAWLCAEISVLISSAYIVWKKIHITIQLKRIVLNCLFGFVFLFACLLIQQIQLNSILTLVVSAIVCGLLSILLQTFIGKNKFMLEMLIRLKSVINR